MKSLPFFLHTTDKQTASCQGGKIMPFSDFQKSTWTVKTAIDDKETVGHEIRFSVLVECLSEGGHNPYGYAQYVEDDKGQRIEIYGDHNQPAYHVTYTKGTNKDTIVC